jgi:hypothetical protein
MEKLMKLSNETLSVLKNFAGINQSLEFKKGNKLTTISSGKSVLAQASLKEEIPQNFCVYDLNQFLSVHSMFKGDVELDFDASNVIFKGGRSKLKYRMASKDMIVTPPEKEIKLGEVDCSFTMSDLDYAEITKATSVLSSPNMTVKSDGESIELVASDAKDDSQHTNSIVVGTGNGKSYSIVFKTDNIKMIPGSYDVQISFKGFAHFKNTKEDIQYWVAFEAKESSF